MDPCQLMCTEMGCEQTEENTLMPLGLICFSTQVLICFVVVLFSSLKIYFHARHCALPTVFNACTAVFQYGHITEARDLNIILML